MAPSTLRSIVLGLSLFSPAFANFILDDKVSFGTDGQIHLTNNAIPGWNLFGEGHAPSMLSDRVILTPPAPGHAKGAMWSDTATKDKHWLTEVSFRASGQERGSGNFQIWFAKDGHTQVSSNSVYSVGKFQGLAILVDQHGGHGGMLRAFLNDGGSDYKAKGEQGVDSLAFGHCNFAYRNLGAPSKITLVNDANGFRVDVDEHQCFYSEKVNLPAGYRFGMTASTAENPDSIEVSRFVVSFATSDADRAPPAHEQDHAQQSQQHDQNQQQQHHQQQPLQSHGTSENEKQLLEQIRKQEAQIAQLQHDLKTLMDESTAYHKTVRENMLDLTSKIQGLNPLLSSTSSSVRDIDAVVKDIKRDISSQDYVGHVRKLHAAVEGVRGGLNEGLPDTLHQSEFLDLNVNLAPR